MKDSAVVAGWIAEGEAKGEAKGQRNALLQLLRLRFPTELREDLMDAVKAESDLAKLSQWFTAAAKADSLKDFRALSGL